VDRIAEGVEEALESLGDGLGAAIGQDLDMDEAGGALDDDQDVGRSSLEPGEVLEIGVHVSEGLGCKALRRVGPIGLGMTGDTMPSLKPMQCRA